MTSIPQHKAAIVATLYILDQAGALAGLSQAEIARRFGLPNRCKISRAMQDVRRLRALVPEIMHEWELKAAEQS
jgi:hypothetical protein